MELVDADYRFIYVDVGAEGRMSDGGVYAHCTLSDAMEKNCLNIPPPEPLASGWGHPIPYYAVCDDAFPLRPHLMKPYSRRGLTDGERICNYRLSRARRVVENAFGILAAVFRVLHTPILLQPHKAEQVVLAVCTLHNFLRKNCRNAYLNPFLDRDQTMSEHLTGMQSSKHKNASSTAKRIRDVLQEYFVTDGKVTWQETHKDDF